MAKSKRDERWHSDYAAIWGLYHCTRLTMEQVSVCMNIPKRYVRQRYPDGWEKTSGAEGRGRGNTIRLTSLLDQEYGVY